VPLGTVAGNSLASGSSVDPGQTVLLARKTKTSGCKLGANSYRRCAPGAYYSKLTTAVICASTFRTARSAAFHSSATSRAA
jgi:hypothetical protein